MSLHLYITINWWRHTPHINANIYCLTSMQPLWRLYRHLLWVKACSPARLELRLHFEDGYFQSYSFSYSSTFLLPIVPLLWLNLTVIVVFFYSFFSMISRPTLHWSDYFHWYSIALHYLISYTTATRRTYSVHVLPWRAYLLCVLAFTPLDVYAYFPSLHLYLLYVQIRSCCTYCTYVLFRNHRVQDRKGFPLKPWWGES